MAGSCWRLLAIFLLMFAVSALVRGQDPVAARAQADEPVRPPKLAAVRGPAPIASIWIPPPHLPRHDPVSLPVFQQLVHTAGIIFSGRVTFVGSTAPASGQYPASITVTFQVEQAVRGASAGQSLTIHEWAGLWGHGEHYYVGERVFLFLYSPGRLGLTSPVAGGMGRFQMNSQRNVVMSPQQIVSFAKDAALGGKTAVPSAEFTQAVLRSSGEE